MATDDIRKAARAMGRKGGRATSAAKARAARENGRNAAAVAKARGKRVGRPPKNPPPAIDSTTGGGVA